MFQIWNAVAGNNPFLSKQQFYTAMRLVSAAQRGGGKLSESEARSILIGLGPALPPPTMAGLEGLKTAVPQILPEAQAAPQVQAQVAQQTDAGFPPMTGDDVQRYQGIFAKLDSDRDGYVLGQDCFGAFMEWGLPKEVLREVWALVAGNQGQLDKHQFVSALYLMDSVKKGMRLPQSLPSKNFPPLSADLGADVTVSDILAGHAQGQDVFSRQIAVPPLPSKARYVGPSGAVEAASRVPPADEAALAGLEYSDRQRLMKERSEAAGLDRGHAKAQSDVEAAKRQQAFFQQHLQELTIFKAKTSAALLQAEEWASREKREAESLQQRYDSTYTQAESQFQGSRSLLADIQAARAKKLELQTRLEALQKDLAQLSDLKPGQLRSENAEIAQLNEKIAELESQLERQDVRGTALRAAIAKLQEYAKDANEKAEAADRDLLDLDREFTILKANFTADDSDHVHELRRLLAVTADTYNSLVEQAMAAGVTLPADAQTKVPPPDLRMEWNNHAAALAADWHDFEDEGFTVVTATEEYSRAAAAAAAKKAIEDAAAARAAAEEAAAAAEMDAAAAAAEAGDGNASDAESAGTHHEEAMDAEATPTAAAAPADTEVDMLGLDDEGETDGEVTSPASAVPVSPAANGNGNGDTPRSPAIKAVSVSGSQPASPQPPSPVPTSFPETSIFFNKQRQGLL